MDRMNYGPGMLRPPIAPILPETTTLHGVAVTDPYAGISDPHDAPTAAYLAAERDYYDERTAGLADLRSRLAGELTARVPATETSAPWEHLGWTYRREAVPGADYERLVRRRSDDPSAPEEVVIDLQQVHDAGGTGFAQEGLLEVSPDGRWLAWSIDLEGDEVYALRFRDLQTGIDLDEVAPRTYYGGAWSADSTSFLYTVHDESYRPFQVWCHRLGTSVTDDVLVLEDLDLRLELEIEASRSGEWVVLSLHGRGFTEEWLVPARDVTAAPRLVRAREVDVEYALTHVGAHGPHGDDGFLVTTNLGASEFQVMWASVDDPATWAPFLPEDPAVRVHDVSAFDRGYVLTMRRGGAQVLRVVPWDGAAFDVVMERAGGMARLARNDDWTAAFVSVELESFLDAEVTWDYDWDGGRVERHRHEVVGVDVSDYVAERRLVPSSDGVEVPVILMRHKGIPLDGSAPCLLYAYGSYESCLDSDWGYDWWRILPSLLDRGAVFAVAHTRGGGELGRRWWDDGHLAAKHHTFDDHVAVGDYLKSGVVSRLVARGGSAGGLLMGAVYGRSPHTYDGLLAAVPFVDVVTSMLDASLPLTAQEWLEWGDPRDPEQHAWLAAYSPMLNLPDVADRPPLLVTGFAHDPRVLVREPARWVARLRASDPAHGAGDDDSSPVSPRTVLFRAELGPGSHGGPSGRFGELIYEAELLAWILTCLGVNN
jgi:oligopeptidase B